ncbi:MAG: efflux RND transporter periplasmic adaptor subunit [Planctomycetia bacterium]|nr:efflux RND transporter periplasmic adaptor subunit [Planctomycetia bacterium]
MSRICLMLAVVFLTVTSFAVAQMPTGPKELPRVSVETVQDRASVTTKKYVGSVDPIEKVVSLARISGDILEVAFKEGDIVEQGQLLFVIDDIRYQAAVKSAEAEIKKTKAKIEYAMNTYNRNLELYETKAVSKDEVENTKSVLSGLEAELQANEAALALAQDDLAHTRIFSMITGRSGRITYTKGNYITPQSGDLVTVVQVSPIYVRFSMSEKDLFSLFSCQEELCEKAKIKIMLSGDVLYEEEGQITFIDNEIKTTTDSVRLWATFPNAKHRLQPGGAVTVYLSREDTEKKPAVRLSAVMFDNTGHYVYIVNEKNIVVKREVSLGSSDGTFRTLLSGVKAGEVVIVDGTHKVMPGDEVVPVEREGAAQ